MEIFVEDERVGVEEFVEGKDGDKDGDGEGDRDFNEKEEAMEAQAVFVAVKNEESLQDEHVSPAICRGGGESEEERSEEKEDAEVDAEVDEGEGEEIREDGIIGGVIFPSERILMSDSPCCDRGGRRN